MLNKKIKLLIVLFLSIAIVIFFYKPLLGEAFLDSDDYNHHAVRTANYYLALKQGQFPVRWGPNLNDGLGYPSFNYTYHFPYVISVLFYSLGFSIQQSVNLSMLSAVLLSVFSSFFLSLFLTKSKKFAFLASLIYVLNPYFLLNVFWRGAIGEMFFIAGVPLFFLAIELIFLLKQKKAKYLAAFLLIFSLCLMILSHVPSILLLLFLSVPYFSFKAIGLYKKNHFKARSVLSLVLGTGVVAIALCAWYFLPAFYEKNYISYDSGRSLTQHLNNFLELNYLLDFSRHIQSSDRFMEVIQLGLPVFIIFLLALVSLFFKNKKYNQEIIFYIFLFLGLIFLIHPLSRGLWDNWQFLQMIQYPWRILWLNAFLSLYLLSILIKKINKKFHFLLFFSLLVLTIYSAFTYSTRRLMEIKSDHDWFQMPTTGTSFDEHRPIWSKKPYVFPKDLLFIPSVSEKLLTEIKAEKLDELKEFVSLDKDYQLEIKELTGSRIVYQIKSSEELIAIHKRLYFPGWKATINGNSVDFLSTLAHYQGVLVFKIPAGENEVVLEFAQRTNLRMLGETISVFSLIITIFGGVYLFSFWKKE